MKIELNYSVIKHIIHNKNSYLNVFHKIIIDSIHNNDIKTIDTIINRIKFDFNYLISDYFEVSLEYGNYELNQYLIDNCNINNNYCNNHLFEFLIDLNKNINDMYFNLLKYYINKFHNENEIVKYILYFNYENKFYIIKYLIDNGYVISDDVKEKNEINIYLRKHKLNKLNDNE